MKNGLLPEQIRRIYGLTDSLGLHSNWVVVPLAASDDPCERIFPDGKLLLAPPGGEAFDAWFEGLPLRLQNLEIDRVPRRTLHDTAKVRVSAEAPPGSGARRLYQEWEG